MQIHKMWKNGNYKKTLGNACTIFLNIQFVLKVNVDIYTT